MAATLLLSIGVLLAILGASFFGFVLAPFVVFGAVIARRQPSNPIGAILLALTVAVASCSDAGQYAVLVYEHGFHLPLGRAAVFLAPGAWGFLLVFLPLPIALFPDGCLARRERWLFRGYLGVCAAFLIFVAWQNSSGLLARRIQVDHNGALTSGTSPGFVTTAIEVVLVVYLLFCAAWLGRLVVAFRRSAGEVRQQLKWLLSAGVLAVSGLAIEFFFSNTGSSLLHVLGNIALAGSLLALPIAFAVAILKYRLYEIDRLISRTLSYAIVTGTLVAVFVGIVSLTTDVLPFSSPIGVAASTLVAAALFNPLRRRVQHLLDHRFNRVRYDSETILAGFSGRLRETVDLATLERELLGAVNLSLAPGHASLWIKPPA